MSIYRKTTTVLRRILFQPLRLSMCVSIAVTMFSAHFAHAQDNPESDAALQQAIAYEAAADYQSAVNAYKTYLQLSTVKSAERRHARLKIPVLQEAISQGAGPELTLYLNAMDLRAQGESQAADQKLQETIEYYPGNSLSDDAWYLRAYIALMDRYDYTQARELLQALRNNHPESRYVDTALFAEAIVLEQQGDANAAIAKMYELRDRHTGLSIGGIDWARDEYVSRLWFERSSNRIEYLEQRAATVTQLISLTPHGRDGFQWQAELMVANQQMTVLLNENETFSNISIKGSNATATDKKVNAYSGIVKGQPDSWARLTIDNPSVRGLISVYGQQHELVPVTSGGSLSDFHTLLLGDADGNTSEVHDHVFLPPTSKDSLNNYLRTIKNVDDVTLTPGSVSHVAIIGVVIDSKYNDYHSGNGVTEALSILNTTDGLFREQLGIALQVETIVVIEDRDNDPMNLGSVSMETMMRNFKDYRVASNDLGSDIGLATLFTGNKNNDAALGLAWIGSACRTDGYDVSVVSPYKMPSLLSTHEIGHTLGAPHDSETACASQNQHMMWPYLSINTGRTFSSCSKQAIAETMQANNCHVDAIDLSIDLNGIDQSYLSVAVTNQNTQQAIPSAIVSISGPGVGNAESSNSCRKINDSQLECSIGSLSPMLSSNLEFQFPNTLAQNAQITATVAGSGFMDVEIYNNSFKTDLYGNLSKHSLPVSSDPITIGSGSVTASANNNTTDIQGGGHFNPSSLLTLLVLVAARRRMPRGKAI